MSIAPADVAGPYHAQMLAHARAPLHQHTLTRCDAAAEGRNALCGDSIRIELALRDGYIADYAFRAEACVLTVAVASMLGERVRGFNLRAARALTARFDQLLDGSAAIEACAELGELVAFAELVAFPARRKCARLPFATLLAALHGTACASTEEA
jgi:nitrogen fixation NifU-like protein